MEETGVNEHGSSKVSWEVYHTRMHDTGIKVWVWEVREVYHTRMHDTGIKVWVDGGVSD